VTGLVVLFRPDLAVTGDEEMIDLKKLPYPSVLSTDG
jgi:hypothetical protein